MRRRIAKAGAAVTAVVALGGGGGLVVMSATPAGASQTQSASSNPVSTLEYEVQAIAEDVVNAVCDVIPLNQNGLGCLLLPSV
jgi:hypothetical protein